MDIEHEPYTATDYVLGVLWMLFCFGPGCAIIGMIAYAIIT